jgi:hypothetical protein
MLALRPPNDCYVASVDERTNSLNVAAVQRSQALAARCTIENATSHRGREIAATAPPAAPERLLICV